jgi:hypothetical protein
MRVQSPILEKKITKWKTLPSPHVARTMTCFRRIYSAKGLWNLIKKIAWGWVWWLIFIIPATQEAELKRIAI